MRHARGENISGVTYRCRECGANVGDPNEVHSFDIWAASVRVHMMQRRGLGIWSSKPLNDLVAAFFVWTTPTGAEVVTSSVK